MIGTPRANPILLIGSVDQSLSIGSWSFSHCQWEHFSKQDGRNSTKLCQTTPQNHTPEHRKQQ